MSCLPGLSSSTHEPQSPSTGGRERDAPLERKACHGIQVKSPHPNKILLPGGVVFPPGEAIPSPAMTFRSTTEVGTSAMKCWLGDDGVAANPTPCHFHIFFQHISPQI